MKLKQVNSPLHRFIGIGSIEAEEFILDNLQLDIKKILIILFVFILPITSINMQRKWNIASDVLNSINYSLGLVQKGYIGFSNNISNTVGTYINLIKIKKHNVELTRKLVSAEALIANMSELTEENNRLRELLNFKEKSQMNLITASVIAYDLLIENNSTIRIDRGLEHGLETDGAVITSKGIAGYILKAYSTFSDVLLITDSRSSVDAVVQRTRARGIVQGNKTFCVLKYLNRSDDVQVGDLIVASGLDNIFPEGYPIGMVSKVSKKNYGITQEVEIKPYIDPLKLEEVFVVMN